MVTRLLLVEDHDIVRQGVRSLIENESGIEIVAEAGNGQEALEICRRMKVDVVLMDINMPVMNGLECTRLLKKEFPEIKILVLSMHDFENYLIDTLQVGANGYILKNSCKSELAFAIRQVGSGRMYIGPEFTISILDKIKKGVNLLGYQGPVISLSEGESQVLELIGEGLTNIQMANRLFISVRTIESRRKKLLEKTGTTNTATLIKFSIKHGLIS
jgi:two-component system response regulator NreC